MPLYGWPFVLYVCVRVCLRGNVKDVTSGRPARDNELSEGLRANAETVEDLFSQHAESGLPSAFCQLPALCPE